jgi:hypothetical protein
LTSSDPTWVEQGAWERVNLVLKATYLHYYVVVEYIVVFMVDLNQSLVFIPLLIVELETLAPSWATFDVPALLASALA